MSVTLKLVIGTVAYTDWLRVSAAKVSSPSTEVFVQYIDVPVTNYILIIPGLDPDDYFIRFRDAPTNVALGTLVSEAFVNAQTGEFLYERRFYLIGALSGGATLDGTRTILTDPYLINKNISGIFKEGFRYLEPTTEWTFNDAIGAITEIGAEMSDGEKFIVEIKYNAGGSVSTSASSLFIATITVTAASYSISALDKGKRFCLDCTGTKQEVTLPPLSSLAAGDMVYLEHKRDGVQAQSRIKTNGTDKVFYNGFSGTTLLSELWASRGGSLYLRKEGSYWEIINDYDGARVGERMAATYLNHLNYLPEDGRLLDGDEYPAIYWFIRNVLPNTHYITDDTVVSGGYVHPGNKLGQFVIHSTLKQFRLPNTQRLYERALKDFDSYGSDTTRPIDYPGGWQDGQVKTHTHRIKIGGSNTADPVVALRKSNLSDGYNSSAALIEASGGDENLTENFGVIYLRHI